MDAAAYGMMDADRHVYDQQHLAAMHHASAGYGNQQQAPPGQHAGGTTLGKQMTVQHVCDHRCSVQHLFGNAYRCESSGQVHICDANCSQRIFRDRFSTVCRVSKKVFPNAWVEPAPCRKRSCGGAEEQPLDACRKRGPGAPAAPHGLAFTDPHGATPAAPGFSFAPGPSGQGGDAMVM